MYYNLHDYCKVVTGKTRGAIYDLNSGKVYSINQSALNLLNLYLQKPFESLSRNLTSSQIHFFDTLTQKGLGSFYINQPIIRSTKPTDLPEPNLTFVWLETTTKCNNRCLHCYTESSLHEQTETLISKEQYLNLIRDIRLTGCSAIQFIGGEPLLYPHWRALIQEAVKNQYEFIEIFTNATLLTDEIIDFLAENKIHIATTIYADNPEIHDKITQNKGSFVKTIAAIEKICKKNIPLRIASILMKQNEHESEKIMNLCKKFGVEVMPPDIIRPTGRGENQNLLPADISSKTIQPPFYISETDFKIAQKCHPCLAGKLAITPNGDVFPCIFARNQLLGNILHTSLNDLLASQTLQTCWKTTKDQITKCKDCEYRYACVDCRPLAQNLNAKHDWYAAPMDCPYDPYKGIWEINKNSSTLS